MGFWELVEDRMRVLGAVNLIVAFPQLANAIIVSRLSSNPSEEFRLRGWSDEILQAMEVLNSKISLGLLNELISRLSNNNMFLENLSDILYYDISIRGVDAGSVYNYLSALEDLGETLSPHVTCLDEELARRILDITGDSILKLKSLDVAFTYKASVRYGEPVENAEALEFNYICSPEWMIKLKNKVRRLATPTPKTLEELKNIVESLIRSNRRMYSYLKLITNLGVKKAYKLRELIEPIPGAVESIRGVATIETPNSIPAFNYSIKDSMLEAMRNVEEEVIKSSGITIPEGAPLVLVEDVPALIVDKFVREFNVIPINGDEGRIVMSIAEKAGKNINVEVSEHILKVIVEGV